MDQLPLILFGAALVVWNGLLTFLLLQQRGSSQKILRGSKKENVIDLLAEVLEKEKKLMRELIETNKKVEGLLFHSQFYIQKIGLVRFNPFNDTGGDQSFILSLIDEQDSGVVISGLHTRNGTRWYAKKVQNGTGVEHELSTDEIKAIRAATKRTKK